MGRSGGVFHEKLPPDSIVTVRSKETPIAAADAEQISPEFIARGMLEMREALGKLARQTENRGNPVDEYNTCPISGAATESTLSLLPTYEYMNEKIISVLISGPAAANVTLTLGDRVWALQIPVSGILTIGPVAIILGRSDTRQLTSATPGNYFLELMGFADARFKS
jgi:hypothetical protein